MNDKMEVLKMGAGIKKEPVVLESGKIIHVAKKGTQAGALHQQAIFPIVTGRWISELKRL